MVQTPEETAIDAWQGFGLALAIPCSVFLGLWMLGPFFRGKFAYWVEAVIGITVGFAQWLWIVPWSRHAREVGRHRFAWGLRIGAWAFFIPHTVFFGFMGFVWILVHLDLSMGFPYIYTHAP